MGQKSKNSCRNRGSAFLSIVFAGLGVSLLGLAVVLYYLYQGNSNGEVKELIIQRGSSIGQVTSLLVENDIIRHPKLFKGLLRVTKGEQKVRAGEFKFHTGMRAKDALSVLYYHEPIVHSITIPEGYSIKQIAEVLATKKLVDPKSFTNKTLSLAYAQKYKFYSPNLEGYLFPDTYIFSKVDGEDRIIDRMVQNFIQKTGPHFLADARKIGMNIESIMTLASIIEKETGDPSERELISSVFHNRLKKGMRLQSDPTTIYSITDYKGNITKADLQRFHPYNTYTIPGLPPGPIASPGLEAIKAALNPAQTEFLFFVSNNQGTHIFTKTYGQHAKKVEETQGRPKKAKQLGRAPQSYGKNRKAKRK